MNLFFFPFCDINCVWQRCAGSAPSLFNTPAYVENFNIRSASWRNRSSNLLRTMTFPLFETGNRDVEFIERKGALWSTIVGLMLIPFFLLIFYIVK